MIKNRYVKFFYILLLLLFMAQCSYFRSALKKENMQNKAGDIFSGSEFCIHIDMNYNIGRIIKLKMQDLFDSKINFVTNRINPECKYLIRIGYAIMRTPLSDLSALQISQNMRFIAMYNVYSIPNNNFIKIAKLEKDLNNISITTNRSISNKFYGIGSKKTNQFQRDVYGIEEVFERDIKIQSIILQHAKSIFGGQIQLLGTSIMNPYILSSEYQSKIDTEEFLANEISNRIYSDIMIKMAEYNPYE